MKIDELKHEVSAWVNGADRYQQNSTSNLDYATAKIMEAVDKYARAKWDEACNEQRDRCVAQFINSDLVKVNQFSAREYCANAPKPEFK